MLEDIGRKDAFPAVAHRASHPAVGAKQAIGEIGGGPLDRGDGRLGAGEELVAHGGPAGDEGAERRLPGREGRGGGQPRGRDQGLPGGRAALDLEEGPVFLAQQPEVHVGERRHRVVAGPAGGRQRRIGGVCRQGPPQKPFRVARGPLPRGPEKFPGGVGAGTIEADQDDFVGSRLLELHQLDEGPNFAGAHHRRPAHAHRFAAQARGHARAVDREAGRERVGGREPLRVGHQGRHPQARVRQRLRHHDGPHRPGIQKPTQEPPDRGRAIPPFHREACRDPHGLSLSGGFPLSRPPSPPRPGWGPSPAAGPRARA